jgi:hypothetical protein
MNMTTFVRRGRRWAAFEVRSSGPAAAPSKARRFMLAAIIHRKNLMGERDFSCIELIN